MCDRSSEQRLNRDKAVALLKENGHLSYRVKGFEERLQQCQMMGDIVTAYNDDAIALIEAGTGTGKSMAYLIPAMLWALTFQERTLIATNTIALQEQLLHKDIPLLIEALDFDLKAVLVQGMGNYACLRKLQEMKHEFVYLNTSEQRELEKVEAWAATTREGSKTSLPQLPSSEVWEHVAADSDSCTGPRCPHYQSCFFFKARREAEDAQIIVANHHLLFADLAVRADTANYSSMAILPRYGRIIIDEAHHIEDIATDFFGAQVSKVAMLRTLSRLATEKRGKGAGKLTLLRDKLEKCIGDTMTPEGRSLLLRLDVEFPASAKALLHRVGATFGALEDFVERRAEKRNNRGGGERSAGEKKLRLRDNHYCEEEYQKSIVPSLQEMLSDLARYAQMLDSIELGLCNIGDDAFHEQSRSLILEIKGLSQRLQSYRSILERLLLTPSEEGKVRWLASQPYKLLGNVTAVDANLDIAKPMVDNLFSRFKTIVLCSATIATNQQFDFIKKRLGITPETFPERRVITSIYDSPFDHMAQALLAIASDMPPPEDSHFIAAATEHIWQILKVSLGGTFLLFTSYEMMHHCYQLLAERLEKNRFNSFKQGEHHRHELLELFKSSPRSVLFGTDSFWEGVDVAGEALRCVIIVKLPFRVPSEPIVEARSEALRAKGAVPFMEYLLPCAIVKFKQGVGRLIRNKNDRGCIICLDNRLIVKGYGKKFLNSVPRCRQLTAPIEQICIEMRNFYRRTHHLVMRAGK